MIETKNVIKNFASDIRDASIEQAERTLTLLFVSPSALHQWTAERRCPIHLTPAWLAAPLCRLPWGSRIGL
jgi:hypothetical protein